MNSRLLPSLYILFLLAGIDGFMLLPQLREVGARPFFIYLPIFYYINRNYFSIKSPPIGLLLVFCFPLLGSLIFDEFHPVCGRLFQFQYGAQFICSLFLVIPLFFRSKTFFSFSVVRRPLLWAIFTFVLLLIFDSFIIKHLGLSSLGYPLFSSDPFRVKGIASEPSYAGAFIAIFSMTILSSYSPLNLLLVISIVSVATTYLLSSRTFIVVVFFQVTSYFLLYSKKRSFVIGLLIVIPLLASLFIAVSSYYSIFNIEESFSSAFRLGSVLAYLMHSLQHNSIIGYGFGASHFIYYDLDFPLLSTLSPEYILNSAACPDSRFLVFNLWVRMGVEFGILPTILLFLAFIRTFLVAASILPVKVFAIGALVMSMSVDSYLNPYIAICLVFLSFGFLDNNDRRPAFLS